MPLRHLDLSADMRWNTKKINAEVLQGIIQGESVADIASRFERVTDMNRVSALRNARTAVTGAENKGRMDGYAQAEKMGVKLKKRWMSALDNRVRHTHRALNGQMRENDKPFEVDGYEIMYPGDPMAAPEMVYNCRCTTFAEVMGADDTKNLSVRNLSANSLSVQDDEKFSGWTNEKNGGIIKSIDVDDFQMLAEGHDIDKKVLDLILNTIKEFEIKGKMLISDVHFGDFYDEATGKRALFQTLPNAYGLTEMNINSAVLSGKTIEEIDSIISNTKINLPVDLKEAVVHECGHAKAYYRKSVKEIRKMNDEIKHSGDAAVSVIAGLDGAECIAEVEVLLYRGEKVPQEAMKLYKKYIRG